jgi:hypothetical protein
MIKAAEKDLDSNQLPIDGDELMSLNHIAIKVTDEPEEELHAPLLVNLVQDTGFKNISVQVNVTWWLICEKKKHIPIHQFIMG